MITIGLDNGIFVRSNVRKLTREALPKLDYPFEKEFSENGVEILYWRKNWGLRNEVVEYLSKYNEPDQYEYVIDTPSQVFEIVKIIISFMNERKWNEDGDSIWEYDEIIPVLQRDVGNLVIISSFMKENPDVYLVFYDSY